MAARTSAQQFSRADHMHAPLLPCIVRARQGTSKEAVAKGSGGQPGNTWTDRCVMQACLMGLVAEGAGRLACRGASCRALRVRCRLTKRPRAAGRRPCSTAYHFSQVLHRIALNICCLRMTFSSEPSGWARTHTMRRLDTAVVIDSIYCKHASLVPAHLSLRI